jgi:hypothetical protein
MPRMLSARPLTLSEAGLLACLHVSMVISYATGRASSGDIILVLLLLAVVFTLGRRFRTRKDTPPPGFLLVGLSFLCVMTGAVLAVMIDHREMDLYWSNLQHLLSYQGFILLPILGIGPFILPRFFGMESSHEFPEALVPNKGWTRKAALALATGVVIIGSFFIEASGSYRIGNLIRFLAVLVYALLEIPIRRAPKAANALGLSIRLAFFSLIGGFLAIAIAPGYRVSLLHLTLIGGFAVITFVVATRVVFGHSGNIQLLKGRNRWMLISVGLMLFAMATRVSGDFWPAIMASHYIYGAIVWIGSVLIWAIYVLPKVLLVEADE